MKLVDLTVKYLILVTLSILAIAGVLYGIIAFIAFVQWDMKLINEALNDNVAFRLILVTGLFVGTILFIIRDKK